MKAINAQRVAGNKAQYRQSALAERIFDQRQERGGTNKHRRAAVEVPGIGKIAAPAQFMQRAPRNNKHRGDEQRRTEPGERTLLRIHHANRPTQHAVQDVIEGIATDVQVDGKPPKTANFLRDGVGIGNYPNHYHERQQHLAADIFHLYQRGNQVDDSDGEEKPQVIEHRFLQQVFQRQLSIDRGKQQNIGHRHAAVKKNTQRYAREMARFGAALTKKQIARNHEEQRDADARGGIEHIGQIPIQRADAVRIGDVPGRGVDHHNHETSYSAQIINPENFGLHQFLCLH